MAGSHIEAIRTALREGAGKIGTANEHAQRNGNQAAEMVEHFRRIAQGVDMTLEGIRDAIRCSKDGSESSREAVRALEDAMAAFRSMGNTKNEDFQEMVEDVKAYLGHARTARSNMTSVEGAVGAPEYVRNLEFLGRMATANAEVFDGQSQLMLVASTEVGPEAQRYTEGLANRL